MPCSVDSDCGVGTGSLCALKTCCPVVEGLPGVCLVGECKNPARSGALMMGRAGIRSSDLERTAAWKLN